MKRIAILVSDGSEEMETVIPADTLVRAGVKIETVSVTQKTVVMSRGISLNADKTVAETDFSEYDGIIIPGGMPGARIISENERALNGIENACKGGKLIAAICASPAVVLAKIGITDNKRVTCYPADGFIKALSRADYTGKGVERDGNLITANGPLSALDFALCICEYLGVKPTF